MNLLSFALNFKEIMIIMSKRNCMFDKKIRFAVIKKLTSNSVSLATDGIFQ